MVLLQKCFDFWRRFVVITMGQDLIKQRNRIRNTSIFSPSILAYLEISSEDSFGMELWEEDIISLPYACFWRESKPLFYSIMINSWWRSANNNAFVLEKNKLCIMCQQKTYFLCHMLCFKESQNHCHPMIINSWWQSLNNTAVVLIRKKSLPKEKLILS